MGNELNNKLKKEDDYQAIYTLKYREEVDDGILNISLNDSNIGDIKSIRKCKLNYICVDLELAFMDLNDLENDSRENFKIADLYDDKNTNYSFENVTKKISNNLFKYNEIIFWIETDNTNSYLIPYYFINRFYSKLRNKNIYIIYINTNINKPKKFIINLNEDELDKLLEAKKKLSKKEIDEYNEKWNEIKNIKCDIRSYKDNKIFYESIDDYFEDIIKYIPNDYSIKRVKLIENLMNDNIINSYSPDMYSYIIDKMIERKILSSKNYKILNFIPSDDLSINKERKND